MAQPVQRRFVFPTIDFGGLGKLLALIGLIIVLILFIVGKMVGIEALLFALAFFAILLL
jgi:hypothetical protein